MKTLKFAHHLIPLILSGEKTSTWRFFDDKDLRVGDMLSFVNRDTKEEFARARIVSIEEKLLQEIREEDFKKGHESFESEEKMLEEYQSYYGSCVTLDTPLKVIQFTLL